MPGLDPRPQRDRCALPSRSPSRAKAAVVRLPDPRDPRLHERCQPRASSLEAWPSSAEPAGLKPEPRRLKPEPRRAKAPRYNKRYARARPPASRGERPARGRGPARTRAVCLAHSSAPLGAPETRAERARTARRCREPRPLGGTSLAVERPQSSGPARRRRAKPWATAAALRPPWPEGRGTRPAKCPWIRDAADVTESPDADPRDGRLAGDAARTAWRRGGGCQRRSDHGQREPARTRPAGVSHGVSRSRASAIRRHDLDRLGRGGQPHVLAAPRRRACFR